MEERALVLLESEDKASDKSRLRELGIFIHDIHTHTNTTLKSHVALSALRKHQAGQEGTPIGHPEPMFSWPLEDLLHPRPGRVWPWILALLVGGAVPRL